YRGDAAFIHLADTYFFGERFDFGLSCFGAGGIHVRNVDGAVVVDVDFRAGRLLDALDRLAARADQQSDLLGVDLHREQSRRPRADLLARITQSRDDVPQNLAAGVAGLVERRPDDLLADAVDLEVELDASNATNRAGHFEIHVAEMILVAHD